MEHPEPPVFVQYEILKIWIPTHGVVKIYRSPRGEYHVDNGCKVEEPVRVYGIEKFRVLTSHGCVVKITRDQNVDEGRNKYTIDPPLNMEQTEVGIEDSVR